jgi:serine/threonine protein phosphatase PrpC
VGTISTSFLYEQKSGKGEDAPPLLRELGGGHGLIAVFDGMGGAGGGTFETPNGVHTGAYIASRLARQVVDELLAELSPEPARTPGALLDPDPGDLDEALSNLLADRLRIRLIRQAERLGGPRSRLRSNLLKVLPTTMSAAHFYPGPDGETSTCVAHWAGDSRVFGLFPDSGLVQLTQDDLRSGGDALANLTQDSPVSNCVNASAEFRIRRSEIRVSGRYVVVAATDGCFGYVSTPAHFEALLLNALVAAETAQEWGRRIEVSVREVAGDDASLAAVALGWSGMDELRESFMPRLKLLGDRFVGPLSTGERELRELQATLAAKQASLEHLRAALWTEYRKGYEQCLPNPAEEGGT